MKETKIDISTIKFDIVSIKEEYKKYTYKYQQVVNAINSMGSKNSA